MANTCLQSLAFRLLFLFSCLEYVHSDVYMHNPRGSNDRLNSNGQNRQNANRLFDSQNNAKGGYNVGEYPYQNGAFNQELQYNMRYFMSGSKHQSSSDKSGKSHLVIEWTNQHGCGHDNLDCNIVLQYMCQDNYHDTIEDRSNINYDIIRNGREENTIDYRNQGISNRQQKYNAKKGSAHLRRGMHEPWEWYDKCRKRQRNKGLFTADQNVKDNIGSTSTRQNPNGNRHGYECPEERDYYPYWHPTDWKDIAVYASSKAQCDFYEYFSFNRRPKGECLELYPDGSGYKHFSTHNNPADCKAPREVWVLFHSFIDMKSEYKDKSSCEGASSEDVPLVWGVPYMSQYVDALEMDPVTKQPKQYCLVQPPKVDCRISPLSRPNHLGNVKDAENMNYTWEFPYFPSQVEKRCAVRIRYNISTMDYDGNTTFSDKNGNNSPVKNDPEVTAGTEKISFQLQLAVNTAQFGRTFQDRSHVVILMPRQSDGNNIPDDIAVYNLNVRGKRGNIVQTYPAVEYDFIPKNLTVMDNDVVQIQWTGSTRNPGNNDGEGRAGTDKNNMVETEESGENVRLKKDGKMISAGKLVWTPNKKIASLDDVNVALASSGFDFYDTTSRLKFQDQLDNSPCSFSIAMSFAPGSYKYMCTRNNNFSNRNQKGSLTVMKSTRAGAPRRANSRSTRRTTSSTSRSGTRARATRTRATRTRATRTRATRTRARNTRATNTRATPNTRARRARTRRARTRRARTRRASRG